MKWKKLRATTSKEQIVITHHSRNIKELELQFRQRDCIRVRKLLYLSKFKSPRIQVETPGRFKLNLSHGNSSFDVKKPMDVTQIT